MDVDSNMGMSDMNNILLWFYFPFFLLWFFGPWGGALLFGWNDYGIMIMYGNKGVLTQGYYNWICKYKH